MISGEGFGNSSSDFFFRSAVIQFEDAVKSAEQATLIVVGISLPAKNYGAGRLHRSVTAFGFEADGERRTL